MFLFNGNLLKFLLLYKNYYVLFVHMYDYSLDSDFFARPPACPQSAYRSPEHLSLKCKNK